MFGVGDEVVPLLDFLFLFLHVQLGLFDDGVLLFDEVILFVELSFQVVAGGL